MFPQQKHLKSTYYVRTNPVSETIESVASAPRQSISQFPVDGLNLNTEFLPWLISNLTTDSHCFYVKNTRNSYFYLKQINIEQTEIFINTK